MRRTTFVRDSKKGFHECIILRRGISNLGGLSGVRAHHRIFLRFFAKSTEWWRVLDFTVLNGSFGPVNGALTFRGEGGTGAKDGFLFALELAPSVILSLGIIAVTEGWAGCAPHNSS